jgi:lysyl-tRNA synthetase class 2
MAESRLESIRQNRIEKLKELKERGINPYPSKFDKEDTIEQSLNSLNEKVTTAGRIMAKREHGQLTFMDLQDPTGQIQLWFTADDLPDQYQLLDLIDVGDFLGVIGEVVKTNTGQTSIKVEEFKILAKAIRPLPEKWHGLKDKEERYRKRYLDMIMNPETRELFVQKFKFWNTMRTFLIDKGFIEVHTPVLETTTGGADAEEFVTHHNALDMDVYLRISMGELWQKRLMVGGFEKTFELGRQFRNEGMSPEHLQDYMQMEFYWAYADYEQGMELVKEMYRQVAQEVLGTQKFKTNGMEVDFSKEWEKIDYVKEVEKQTGVNYFDTDIDEIKAKLDELKVEYEADQPKERLMDTLWKQCRQNIVGPAFVVNIPVEVSPLAKRKQDNPRLVERFFPVFAGSEIGNGYSELNDPIDQEERFKRQQEMRDQGDEEAQMHDKDFVEALEYGMPPTCGFGTSLRFFAYLVDRPIKECQIFPLMKPKEDENG